MLLLARLLSTPLLGHRIGETLIAYDLPCVRAGPRLESLFPGVEFTNDRWWHTHVAKMMLGGKHTLLYSCPANYNNYGHTHYYGIAELALSIALLHNEATRSALLQERAQLHCYGKFAGPKALPRGRHPTSRFGRRLLRRLIESDAMHATPIQAELAIDFLIQGSSTNAFVDNERLIRVVELVRESVVVC